VKKREKGKEEGSEEKMGGSKKTFVPYATFQKDSPRNTGFLSAVGACRIYPKSIPTENNNEYQSILEKTIQQSQAVFIPSNIDASTTEEQREDEKKNAKILEKKYMKHSVAMAKTYLIDALALDPSIIDIEVVIDASDIIKSTGCIASCFLDAGCDKIVFTSTQSNNDGAGNKEKTEEEVLEDSLNLLLQALDVSGIPKERISVQLQSEQISALKEKQNDGDNDTASNVMLFTNTISVSYTFKDEMVSSNDVETCTTEMGNIAALFASASETSTIPTVVVEVTPTENISQFVKGVSKYCSTSLPKTIPCGTVTLIDPTAEQLGSSWVSCISTDRSDELYTTVVTTRMGEALGLVYSNAKSVIASLECGRGVYWSRNRGLWRKGDTSGHYQTLHRIDVDCDGDAMRFTVTQESTKKEGEEDKEGAFCHLYTLTCWGEPNGLRHLEQTLRSRMRKAPEGSYTKRLFDDSELLRDKLVEEAQELSEADEKEHVAEELADVLYFAMVKAVKAGVSIDDAVRVLDERQRKVTRRKGDSKEFRIEAGKAILSKKKDA